mgnify:CR=1 FL=1
MKESNSEIPTAALVFKAHDDDIYDYDDMISEPESMMTVMMSATNIH